MRRLRRPCSPCLLFVLAATALGVSACAGEDETGARAEAAAPQVTVEREAPAPPPPPPPEAAVVVEDGDTGKPIEGARVVVAGEGVRTDRDGTVSVAARGGRVAVRLSAPGYGARKVKARLRERRPVTLRLWRPSLQWPLYGATAARTQAHPTIKVRPPFRRVWVRPSRGFMEFSAVVWNGVGYVHTMRGRLRAFSMSNGRLLWKQRVGTLTASSPAVDPERGVIVSTSMSPGNVTVTDMDTGRVRWRFPSGTAEPSPVIRDGVAYLGATNGNVYALDLDRRRPRWTYRGGVKITSSPALVGNRLYFGDYAGRVFALDARTGRVVWRGSAGTKVYGTVAVANGRVLAPSVGSGLSALSARTGRLLWRIPTGAYLYSSPAVYRNRVFFGTYGSRVYAADVRTGRILWSRPAGGRVSGAVQVVAGIVYAANIDRGIGAWNWRTGRQVWSFPHGEYVPISGSGRRLLVHGRDRIWAFESRRRR